MKSTDFDYELFFNLSLDLLCIAGYDGYFKKVNPAVSELLEYSFEELYSRPVNDFIHPDDRDSTTLVREKLKKSAPLHYFENRYVKKSGEVVWLAWTSQPVESKQLVFAIAKNITHKKKLESERNELVENLSTVNQEIKQLSLTTSHDLRSPLTSLMAVFDLLDESKISDNETLQLIKILKLTASNLKTTLNNFVDVLSEKMSEQFSITQVDAKETLSNVLQSIASIIKKSNTTIKTDFSQIQKIRFNKSYLESVYLNLITNSIKYAQDDIPPVIHIRTEKGEGETRLIFEDNGRGFNMEKVKGKIFGMHQTFHSHEDSKGIGLYLVHSHVTGMGGTIEVESEVNKGTTFTIALPVIG